MNFKRFGLVCFVSVLSAFQLGFPGCDSGMDTNPELTLIHEEHGNVSIRLNEITPVTRVTLAKVKNPEVILWEANTKNEYGAILPLETKPFLIGRPGLDCVFVDPETRCHPKELWNYTETNLNDLVKEHGKGVYVITVTFPEGTTKDESINKKIELRHTTEAFSQVWESLGNDNIQTHFWRPTRIFEESNNQLTSFTAMNPVTNLVIQYRSINPVQSSFGPIVADNLGGMAHSSSTPLSRILENADRSLAVAQIAGSSGHEQTLGLYVLESNQPGKTKKWLALGGQAAPILGTSVLVPSLTRGLVKGYNVNQNKPYVVAGADKPRNDHSIENPQGIAIRYYHSNKTWQPIPTTGLTQNGTAIGGIDLAVTENGELFACTQNVKGYVKLHQFEVDSRSWNTLDSAFNNQIYTSQAHYEVCTLHVEKNTVTAVGFKAGFRLWIRRYNSKTGLESIPFEPEELISQNPDLYGTYESPKDNYVIKIWDVEVRNGDIYVAWGDFAAFPIFGGDPYSRVFHLVKFNGEEWSRIVSGVAPHHPGLVQNPELEEDWVTTYTTIQDLEISKDFSTLHLVGRSYIPSTEKPFSLVAWTL